MIHLKEIRQMMDEGKYDDALVSLENLLEIGPKNIEAKKLKALIFRQEGRLLEEEAMWMEVVKQDPEDVDGVDYLYSRHVEEREHFYFTDLLPQGRRYLAYPRGIMTMSVLLLLGCMVFLMLSNFSRRYLFLANEIVLISSFAILVVFPLLGILYSYVASLRDVLVGVEGIKINTLLKSYHFSWQDIREIYLAYDPLADDERQLTMLLVPHDDKGETPLVEINLSPEKSSLRARTFFIHEVKGCFGRLVHAAREEITNLPPVVRTRHF